MKAKLLVPISIFVVIAFISLLAHNYAEPIIISMSNSSFVEEGSIQQAKLSRSFRKTLSSPTPIAVNSFTETFETGSTLQESGSMNTSTSSNWWLNSGGYFVIENGVGRTVRGNLPTLDRWRVAYSISNPGDTDNGYHPQNIFRLLTKTTWQNFTQEGYFNITNDNLSSSSNRNSSNGFLFFNRYKDGNNLYYTGLRVDGYAVIKKKINGSYYTMAYKSFLPGSYNRDSNPNLIPKNTWIGLRTEVKTNANNSVTIKLYIDKGKTGNWVLAAEAIDDGQKYGGAAFLEAGYAGIRTDFMDIQFDDYKLNKQ